MKKTKGITLIALVITIIILLILAGISIATLTGENGLLGKVNTAKTETKKAGAEEQVKLAVMGSHDGSGKLDPDKVKEELGKIPDVGEIRDTDGGFSIEVDLDGYTFEIDEDGKVTRKAIKPKVTHTISPETQVPQGEKITITINATIAEGTIARITVPDGNVTENANIIIYEVTENDDYEFIVEGSNGEKTTHIVEITNGKNVEKFSDIYTETKPYTDKEGNTAKIPKGFAVGTSKNVNTINNGLVITDAVDENNYSTGNEFVWVPVNNKADFKRIEGYYYGNRQNIVSDSKCSEPFSGGSTTEKNAYTNMYNSVTNESNKGFYIGRYEAGKDGSKAAVKENLPVYNGVRWSGSGAYSLALGFVNDKPYKNIVTSSLCYGVQWDATMQFFDSNYVKGSCASDSYVRNSTGVGWRPGTNQYHNTGVYANGCTPDKVKNIYDMAGNVYEWTMEGYGPDAFDRIQRVCRGGAGANGGASLPPSCRQSFPHMFTKNPIIYLKKSYKKYKIKL